MRGSFWRSDPAAALRGQTITLTANSTGDYAVQSCLNKYGLKKSDVVIKNMGQAEIISALPFASATTRATLGRALPVIEIDCAVEISSTAVICVAQPLTNVRAMTRSVIFTLIFKRATFTAVSSQIDTDISQRVVG
jgi:ABC-type taurine transport system substrate-binding protein